MDMNARNLQFIVSLIEAEYEEQNHPSFAHAVYTVQEQVNADMTLIIPRLKRKYGPPTGSISRVVSKRMYDYLVQSDEDVFEVIEAASDSYNMQPVELSDDQLVRYLIS